MNPWTDLAKYARKQYSQCGEEGILTRIFELIGETNRVSVEFGCGDGFNLSNTRFLKEKGWTSHFWDSHFENEEIKRYLVTAENVSEIFAAEKVPVNFDLLSLDIDGNDYWVWKALSSWRPRVVVIEFNAALLGKKTIPYEPTFRHDGTNYYGASFDLLVELGRDKGYVPVCQILNLNLFFVREELLPFVDTRPKVTYTQKHAHPPDPHGRPWHEVTE